jgi:hypothetical protein
MENAMDENLQDVTSGTNAAAPDICLTSVAQQYLNQTRPWARFMSIVMFVFAGLMVLAGLAMFLAGLAGGLASHASQGDGRFGPMMAPLAGIPVGLLYIIMAILYIAPGVFLARYASAIASLEMERSAAALENALKQQKSFWRFVGIMTVIGLVLTVLAIVIGIIFAVLAASSLSKF